MAIPVLDNEPTEIHAGTTVKWKRSLSDFPAPTWTLTYSFRGCTDPLDVAATADGSDHAVTITQAQTTALNPTSDTRLIWWDAYVSDGSERAFIGTGQMSVSADLSAVDGKHDGRTHAQKTLDAIKAVIQGKATTDQRYIIVGDRQIHRLGPDELVKWRDVYRSEVAREEAERDRANGIKKTNQMGVRFVNP